MRLVPPSQEIAQKLLAAIVPQRIRIVTAMGAQSVPFRDSIRDELRAMPRHHLGSDGAGA